MRQYRHRQRVCVAFVYTYQRGHKFEYTPTNRGLIPVGYCPQFSECWNRVPSWVHIQEGVSLRWSERAFQFHSQAARPAQLNVGDRDRGHNLSKENRNYNKKLYIKICNCKLQHATSNLQQTYITAAIRVARKWAAPRP